MTKRLGLRDMNDGSQVNLATTSRYLAKRALRPLLFRHPPVGLQPERLYLWLKVLMESQDVDGAVLEIGCSSGGTAALAGRMLSRIGSDRRYVCVDTFGGFVDEQFDVDADLGTPRSTRHAFSANSPQLVRKILDGLGAEHVELVTADITTIDPSRLPHPVAACLVDVDLSEPVYAALVKVLPLLSPGGTILVDDCPEIDDWHARRGYQRFVKEQGVDECYELGMGIVRKPR